MKRFVFAVAAAMAVVACAKEATPTQNQGAFGFSAVVEQQNGATKTTLEDGAQVVWTAGDEVCMYHWDDGTVTYAGFTAETAGTSTTFESNPEHDGGLAAVNTGDIAIYPFHEGNTLANTLTDDHTVTFTTSVDQTYVPNSFPAGANVAVGVVAEVGGKPFVNFRNVFGVLKLSFTGKGKVKSIRIEDNEGKKLTGDFSVDLSNSATPVFTQTGGSDYILLNCGEEGVQLNSSTPTDFYIVVPTGAFAQGFTATVNLKGVNEPAIIATDKNNIINRSHLRDMPRVFVTTSRAGLLDGVFSIGTDKKISFSSGNLQCEIDATGAPVLWKFAEHQWDIIGTTYGYQIGTVAGTMDSFSWSTDGGAEPTAAYRPYGINISQTTEDYAGTFVDWGNNTISNADNTIEWFTLDKDQWTYLLSTRVAKFTVNGENEANNRCAPVKVNNQAGMLVFPDTFNWATETMGDAPATYNTYSSNWNGVNYTEAQFAKIEEAGGVFLPADGYRYGSSMKNVGTYGVYSSSSPYGDGCVYEFIFNTSNFKPASAFSNTYRWAGRSVRLVALQ